MNIQEINIGEQVVYLVIEPLKFEDKDENTDESYVCYYNFRKPTIIIYGQLMKESGGKPIEFSSVEEAINYAKLFFDKKIIFKHPLNYNKEQLQKILNIPLRIEFSNGDETKELIGSIVSFSNAHNPPFLPYTLNINLTDGSFIDLNVLSITKFSNL